MVAENSKNRTTKICLFLAILIGAALGGFAQKLPEMPMIPQKENSLEFEWAQKKVLESKLLSDAETMGKWEHGGFGVLSVTTEKVFKGNASLKLVSPTKGEKLTEGRPWGVSSAIYKVAGEDWSDWNRLSFWIYPDLPGFRVVSISLVFHNDGVDKVPDTYNRNGLNYQILENHKWNKVTWEVEHLGREKVTGVELRYRLQGNEPEAADTAVYYIDELVLEKVKPDHYEGWNVAPGYIAYNHLGYPEGIPKTALVSDLTAKSFSLVNTLTGREVLQKAVVTKKTSFGTFQVMDFTEIDQPGTYILKVGGIETKPFRIGPFADVFQSSVFKTINHFYTQRCGFEIPGVHSVCHSDWVGTYNNQTMVINGGWHDAGDLSQGLANTSEAVFAMAELAGKLQNTEPSTSDRLLDEAVWGLDWMLKTRFENGFRINWSTMDFFTDGIIGTVDDVPSKAQNSAQGNFLSAKAEAAVARLLSQRDPIKAKYALKCAGEDWDYASKGVRNWNAELAGNSLNTSLVLFEATSDEKYKNAALANAAYILSCQQTENLTKDINLKGFFFRDSTKEVILHYNHRGHEQETATGLVKLCILFPNHPEKKNWEKAIRLYAGFYKEVSKQTDPWFMLPAGIFDLSKARDSVEQEQIKSGIKLNERYYLKNFPTWKDFRGNSGTILSQAKGLAAIATYFGDKELQALCYRQLDWHLGFNPFCQSLMYGEGYRFAGQYSMMSGNLTGGLPVGVQTHFNRDVPYWPAENCYNWKEIWVHPSSRWLWIMSDFYQ